MDSSEFKKIRESLGFTQENFGEKIGKERASIQRYESGQIEIPKTVELLLRKWAKIKKIKEIVNDE